MTDLQKLLNQLKDSNNYVENASLMQVLLNSFTQKSYLLNKQEVALWGDFIFDEMQKFIKLIPETKEAEIKDEIFYYVDTLMGLFMFLQDNHFDASESYLDVVKTLIKMFSEERFIETTIDEVFESDQINKNQILGLLDMVKSLTNEYQRGKFYLGLLHHKDNINKITFDAKYEVTSYLTSELERYLDKMTELSEEEASNLEIMVDICKYFLDDKIIALLNEFLNLKNNHIRYYAIESLLIANQKIEKNIIVEMANDLIHANLTYELLKQYNLLDLFPQELSSPEYLAKSDLIHWLTFPTELGEVPEAIELLGDVEVKGETYYIFKFKSNSDNLTDEIRGEWLIGWSSTDGGTFSNFDLLSTYEQKSLEKTLKVIKKKLLG